jgi:hypothetical protein
VPAYQSEQRLGAILPARSHVSGSGQRHGGVDAGGGAAGAASVSTTCAGAPSKGRITSGSLTGINRASVQAV